MRSQSVSILDGNNFVVSDVRGDIDASPTEPLGLFNWDTRYLSRWQLRIDGKPLDPLSIDELQYFSTSSSWSQRPARSTPTPRWRSSASDPSATGSTRT